jgi:hypothetical protein
VKVFPFERSADLITVTARVWGARGDRELLLVLDTVPRRRRSNPRTFAEASCTLDIRCP